MRLRVPEASPRPSGEGLCPHYRNCPKSCSLSIIRTIASAAKPPVCVCKERPGGLELSERCRTPALAPCKALNVFCQARLGRERGRGWRMPSSEATCRGVQRNDRKLIVPLLCPSLCPSSFSLPLSGSSEDRKGPETQPAACLT